MPRLRKQSIHSKSDPTWYKRAIIYEVPVRAFFDSNGDGIGDFRGLIQKLDYLQELGVTALWLLPFYPSPLKDDGYDIADYYSINPIYGTLTDFKEFLREAHVRGLRVITELVLNHTSDQHEWFQRSRRAKAGSPERDFYVWSDSPEKYKDARIIFKDFEPSNWTWDPLARAYYWHRFYSHQPDLNFDSPRVHREIRRIFEFWLDLGVDGFRLDAVPYLYEREGTSCESLLETHQYLKNLRMHLDAKYGDRMLLAEANQWPEEAVTYFGAGKGDECHMAFHFPLMPRLFMSVRMEDRFPVVDILAQTPAIPETSQWALFLRNHDELTLEMVTDEERDYMYRVYASDAKARLNLGIRRRLGPLLGNDRKRIELLNLLLFSLPGTPVLYYGDEIGMGDNIFLGDRNGVRTPMQWSADRNAGFSRASPQALYAPIILDPEYHYEAINVETLQRNPHSLLWWTRRLLALRKSWKVFGLGSLEFLHPENRKVLAFIRHHENETVLVVANLSRFPQPVELDLSAFEKHVPVELFGRTEFPVIGRSAYPLTLSPHAAFWFSLEPAARQPGANLADPGCETLAAGDNWEDLLSGNRHVALEGCLPAYLRTCRWFLGLPEIKSVRFREILPLPVRERMFLTVLLVEYVQHEPEEYLLPLAFAMGAQADDVRRQHPHCAIAQVQLRNGDRGLVYDAVASTDFSRALLELLARRRQIKGREGVVETAVQPDFRALQQKEKLEIANRTEHRNSSIIYGDKVILKLLRRLETGNNPELEANRFLTAKKFPHVPALAGALEYQRIDNERLCFGIATSYIPNATNGWNYMLDTLRRYFDRVRAQPQEKFSAHSLEPVSIAQLTDKPPPDHVSSLLGTALESARLLGRRTAGMHLVLASDLENKDFAPEPFTPFYQRSLYQSLRNHLLSQFGALRRKLKSLHQPATGLAEKLLALQEPILKRMRGVHETHMSALRIRCHGDFHLTQVLHTGKDFVIIDFEGEPVRPIGERRIKRSPLRDVAGMIRSFDYAAHTALAAQHDSGNLPKDEFRALWPWAQFWAHWTSVAFLTEYLAETGASGLLPKTRSGIAVLLDAFVLDKAISEMGHEMNNRPDWLHVPLQAILQMAGVK
jgi:maltose alpha-D-glucosyltransferase/alpha-amylase